MTEDERFHVMRLRAKGFGIAQKKPPFPTETAIAALITYANAHPVQTDEALEKRRDAAWRRSNRFADMIGGCDG